MFDFAKNAVTSSRGVDPLTNSFVSLVCSIRLQCRISAKRLCRLKVSKRTISAPPYCFAREFVSVRTELELIKTLSERERRRKACFRQERIFTLAYIRVLK